MSATKNAINKGCDPQNADPWITTFYLSITKEALIILLIPRGVGVGDPLNLSGALREHYY